MNTEKTATETTKKTQKPDVGEVLKLAALLQQYDPSAYRSLTSPSREALRVMGTEGEAARIAREIRSRCEDGRVLAEALERIADGQAARRVEIEASDA